MLNSLIGGIYSFISYCKRKTEKLVPLILKCLTIQILHYEFLGPIKLSEWGPPMEEIVYVLFSRIKDAFSILYVGESDKTNESDFFTKNEKFKCWVSHAGSYENLYLAIYPMWNSQKEEREQIVKKTITKYKPVCNMESQPS